MTTLATRLTSRAVSVLHRARTARRFLIFAVGNRAAQTALLFLFVDWGHVNYILASWIAVLITIAGGYAVQKFWVFRPPPAPCERCGHVNEARVQGLLN